DTVRCADPRPPARSPRGGVSTGSPSPSSSSATRTGGCITRGRRRGERQLPTSGGRRIMEVMASQAQSTVERRLLGRYIVADPEICHGQPTFLGTRILVPQVLRQVVMGMTTDAIIRE